MILPEVVMEKDMEKILEKAEVLVEALPYIQKFTVKIFVLLKLL